MWRCSSWKVSPAESWRESKPAARSGRSLGEGPATASAESAPFVRISGRGTRRGVRRVRSVRPHQRERGPPRRPQSPLPSPASAGEGPGVRARSCSGIRAGATQRPCRGHGGSHGGERRPEPGRGFCGKGLPAPSACGSKPRPSPGAARHPLPLMRERDPPRHPQSPLRSSASAGEGPGVRARSCSRYQSRCHAAAESRPRPLPRGASGGRSLGEGSVGKVFQRRVRVGRSRGPHPALRATLSR